MGRQDVHAEERRDATDEEIQTLPHVADSISFNVGVALLASAAERFSFYAVTTPWRKRPHTERLRRKIVAVGEHTNRLSRELYSESRR